jgi:hypothetical protein
MRYVTWGRGLPRDKLEELMEFILAGLVAPNGQAAPKGTPALKWAPVLPPPPRPPR